MKPKQFKVKAPKFKIKEYKVPEYSKYVVVTNPWSKPTFLSGNGRRENERFANTIGGWFEKMTGQPVQTIYFQSNKEFIIVELEHNVDVNLILGAHHTQDFFKIPTRAEISEIYVYDYLHQGCPNTTLKWESLIPSYDKKDLMELRVKEKEDYPPPRKTKTSKPPTHFAQPLSSELQELITARRSSYEESQPASSILFNPPPIQDAPQPQAALPNEPGPSTLEVPPVSPPSSYTPPATLIAMRNNRQTNQDTQQVHSQLHPSRRSLTFDDERDSRQSLLSSDPRLGRRFTNDLESQVGGCSGHVERHVAEAKMEADLEANMIKPQTHDFLTDFRSNAVHRHPKIEGFADDTLLNTEESEPLKLPKVEEDLLPKKEKEPESYVSEERIRLWNELQALRQAEAQNDQAQFRMQDPSNTRFVNFDRSRDMPVKNEEPDSRSSPSKSVGLERRPKIEGSDDALVPRKGASEGQLEMQHFSNARVTNMEGLGNGKEPDRRRIEPGSLDRRKEKKFDYAPERRSGNNPSNFPHVVKHERNDRNSSDSEQSRVGSPSAQANSGGHYDIKRVKREHW